MTAENQAQDRTVFRQTEAQFLLRGVSGIMFGRNFTLVGSMIVGREKNCDIAIPNDEISRQHARIITRPGSILLEDLGSSNGTFVNGKPIDKAVVIVGDEIRFDKIRFNLQSLNQIEELLTEPQGQRREYQPTQPRSNKKIITLGLLSIIALISAAAYFLI